jgi:hypothetical protein
VAEVMNPAREVQATVTRCWTTAELTLHEHMVQPARSIPASSLRRMGVHMGAWNHPLVNLVLHRAQQPAVVAQPRNSLCSMVAQVVSAVQPVMPTSCSCRDGCP